MSATSEGCEWCGKTFTGTTILDAESKRIDHEATCDKRPQELD
jgi:hypothetical protein